MSEKEIARIKKKSEELEKRILKLERPFSTKTDTGKKKSIKEFILQKRPKNDIQKALTIGYYLERYESFPSFNVRDLERGFRDAREKVPQNVGDKIQKNIAKGFMMDIEEEKDGLKAYALTNSGEEFVENDFKEQG